MRFKQLTARHALMLLSTLLIVGLLGWLAMAHWTTVRTMTFVIPPGTGERLALKQEVTNIPSELVFTLGVKDILIVENQDNVVHSFGPFVILPHTTLRQRFKTARVYQNTCTLHQDQQMTLVINPAPWDIFNNTYQKGEQF